MANEVNEATGATAIEVIVVTAAMTDETDTGKDDARDPPTTALPAIEAVMAMHMHPAETTEIGSARSDTRAAATDEATENGTETVAAHAAMLDAMMMAMAGAIAKALMTIVGVAETAVMTDSLASQNAEARRLLSAASPHLI